MEPASILVVKSRHIGDVLLTAPLVATLRLRYPSSRIVALVKPGCEAMLADHPDLHAVWSFPKRGAGEGKGRYLWRYLLWIIQLRRERFTWVVNTTEGDRGIIAAFLSGASRRLGLMRWKDQKLWRRRLLTETVDELPGLRHTVLRGLDLVRHDGGVESRRVELVVSEADLALVAELLKQKGWDGVAPLVQVHPASRWFFKCWGVAPMATVIDHLQDRGFVVVLSSGPEARERNMVAEIVAHCQRPPLDVSGRLSLKQTAALSRLSRLFFGVDTAPMHMAAAMNTPVVALFGPSGAFDWGPWPNGWPGADSPYPAQSGVQRAGPHLVIQKDWPCVPCGKDGCKGSKRSDCLDQLTAAEVVPLLDAVLPLPKEAP